MLIRLAYRLFHWARTKPWYWRNTINQIRGPQTSTLEFRQAFQKFCELCQGRSACYWEKSPGLIEQKGCKTGNGFCNADVTPLARVSARIWFEFGILFEEWSLLWLVGIVWGSSKHSRILTWDTTRKLRDLGVIVSRNFLLVNPLFLILLQVIEYCARF